MRLALITDLHANAQALDAALADAEAHGADRVICLGDVATLGPSPHQVISTLRDRGIPCIMGNHDEFLIDASLVQAYTEAPAVVDAIDWCRERMSEDQLGYLRDFVRHIDLDLGHGLQAHLFHGSPRSHTEDLMADAPAALLDEVLPKGYALYAGGHTHFPLVRQHRGAWLLNPGSCGLPFSSFEDGVPKLLKHAAYALIDSGPGGVSCTLRRVHYDREAYRAAVEASDNPLVEWLLSEF